jgi:hypothetical protein
MDDSELSRIFHLPAIGIGDASKPGGTNHISRGGPPFPESLPYETIPFQSAK